MSIVSPWKVILLFAFLFFFAVTQSYALDVTLEWDPNTEPDLDGYKVYYKTGSSGPPYSGKGATEGDSPIDIGNVTTYSLHGLTDGITYFFVVTAYDTEDLESDYSNEVNTSSITPPEPSPTPTPSRESGDGGGCFIATAAFGLNLDWYVKILSAFRDRPSSPPTGPPPAAPFETLCLRELCLPCKEERLYRGER